MNFFSDPDEDERDRADLRRMERGLEDDPGVSVNVQRSGSDGGFRRRGWRAESLSGPWLNLVSMPAADTVYEGPAALRSRPAYLLLCGVRPWFSVTVEVTRFW